MSNEKMTDALSSYIAAMQSQHDHAPLVRDGKLLDQRDEDRFAGWRLRGELDSELHAHLLHMLGVRTHQEAGAEIGRLHAARLRGEAAQTPCKCVDCDGTEPVHSRDCTYMAGLIGEAPQGEQQAVAWAVVDGDGVMSFASKREHTVPFCNDPAYTVRPLVYGECPQPVAVAGDAVRALRDLRHAYVRLLESGRDRIMDLGGSCDPVDVMERGDIDLRKADAAIAALSAAPAAPPPGGR